MFASPAGGSVAASPSLLAPVAGPEDVGGARRAAIGLGAAVGLSEAVRSDLGIVATELATNVVRHGRGGQVIMRALVSDGPGVELIGIDRGPGIANLPESFRDGFSTAGSMGTGLGAMRRIAAELDVWTSPEHGTAVVARVRAPGVAAPGPGGGSVAGISLPKPGEIECGDGWTAVQQGGRTVICVVDGLGHGPSAADAATRAREVFHQSSHGTPTDILEALHRGLRPTRGAAAAVAVADAAAGSVRFGGIGNISGIILSPAGDRSMVSHNGIVGHQMRRVQEFEYPWAPGATMVLHSDGLATHWRADTYPGVLQRDPALLCALLHRDCARGRDDVTVVACRASLAS